MSKVLSCKVEDSIYNIINSLEESNSEVLRDLVTNYVESLENNTKNNGILQVYHSKEDYEYILLCKALDSLTRRHNRFFTYSTKKPFWDDETIKLLLEIKENCRRIKKFDF